MALHDDYFGGNRGIQILVDLLGHVIAFYFLAHHYAMHKIFTYAYWALVKQRTPGGNKSKDQPSKGSPLKELYVLRLTQTSIIIIQCDKSDKKDTNHWENKSIKTKNVHVLLKRLPSSTY